MTTKICLSCKEEKDFYLFYKSKNNKNGLSTICKDCKRKETNKKYRVDYINNTCAFCSKTRLTTSKFCLYHFVYNIVVKWDIQKDKYKQTVEALIKKLEDSEYCCHYSGLKITPGFSASIDHRIPQVKGGSHDLTNLVWCHKSINKMKDDLSEKEFINRSANILVELNFLDSKGEL